MRILEVAEDDAYYKSRSDHEGVLCTAGDDMSVKGGGWYGGQFDDCTNGKDPYYYKVRAEKVSDGSTLSGRTP